MEKQLWYNEMLQLNMLIIFKVLNTPPCFSPSNIIFACKLYFLQEQSGYHFYLNISYAHEKILILSSTLSIKVF